jgi:hypothetical protein
MITERELHSSFLQKKIDDDSDTGYHQKVDDSDILQGIRPTGSTLLHLDFLALFNGTHELVCME